MTNEEAMFKARTYRNYTARKDNWYKKNLFVTELRDCVAIVVSTIIQNENGRLDKELEAAYEVLKATLTKAMKYVKT